MGIQNLSVHAAIVLTGLSAGLFYAWSVSVIPGTLKVDNLTYLKTMQSINRAILNPAFFLVFFGSLIALAGSAWLTHSVSPTRFWFLLIATLTYLIGTVGVTGLGNVPLNNELDTLPIWELTTEKIAEFREYFESRWNRLQTVRMLFSVLAFVMALLAVNFPFKN